MNLLVTNTLLLFLSIGWFSDNQQFNNLNKIEDPKTDEALTISDDLYDLQIKIETTEYNTHNLVFDIKLHKGSQFISPYAKRDFKGKFFMDLGSYNDIGFQGEIIETPRSVEEFDSHPFVFGTVNWVRVNTIYKQPLKLKAQGDVEVFGRIKFTIEPRCTLEQIPFSISYKSGKMQIKEAKC